MGKIDAGSDSGNNTLPGRTGVSTMQAWFASGIEHLMDPMTIVNEGANRKKEEIDAVVRKLGLLPRNRVMPYIEKHPEIKVLLGMDTV